jgi:predicted nucleic acid-binding protein
VIHLDTSVLIDALTGPRRSAPALRAALASGERIAVSTLVLYEWLRGPRQPEEIDLQEQIFPRQEVAVYGPAEAARAAVLYQTVRRPRGREIDLAIAACALTQEASFWTLNEADFRDVDGLSLYQPDRT